MKKILFCLSVLLTCSFTTLSAESEAPAAETVNRLSLIQQMPAPGRIVRNVPNKEGFTRYTLSNGITVLFHQDCQRTNEVTMYALSNGGTSLYPNIPAADLKVLNECLALSGLGRYSERELQQTLDGHKVTVTPYIGMYGEFISSSTTPKELETMFQLNHLYFTSLRTDLNAFNSWREHKREEMSANGNGNDNGKDESAYALTAKELDIVNYDLVMQVVAQRFSNAGDFTFVISGNISEETLIPLLEKYIASLRTSGKHEQADYHAYDATSRTS